MLHPFWKENKYIFKSYISVKRFRLRFKFYEKLSCNESLPSDRNTGRFTKKIKDKI